MKLNLNDQELYVNTLVNYWSIILFNILDQLFMGLNCMETYVAYILSYESIHDQRIAET